MPAMVAAVTLDNAGRLRHEPAMLGAQPRAAPRSYRLAAIRKLDDPPRDPQLTALQALGWILSDEMRAQRFLDLTGLSPEVLRATAGTAQTQCAVLDYLAAHEPDLVEAAGALSIEPGEFTAARLQLAR